MEFGKLEDISRVKFSLPPDQSGNLRVLSSDKPSEKLRIYVGCPIWVNKNWLGTTYPAGTKEKDFLKQYAFQFNTIELNSTHYHIPDPKTIEKWIKNTGENFRFSPKFPQEISHQLLPEGKARTLSLVFCDVIRALEIRLGTSFIQLPPHFTLAHLPLLEKFLNEFPTDIPLAVEFRHRSWFQNPDLGEAAFLLEDHQVGTVLTDVAGRRDVLHMRLTTPQAIIRFVGNGLHPTDYERIDDWVLRLKTWIDQGLEELYFFVHQPNNDKSPELARYFIQKINKVCSLALVAPKLYNQAIQQKLFE
ncbi:MAG: DUF72 domain-containing protein [Microscillaceae bacterium]|nr:DUF72 domain-containing protein [Microscillaceae bacterium]